MKSIYDTATCIALLQQKPQQLLTAGLSRYPRRDDFTEDEVVAIKAHLGPWPRALETAGIKPLRQDHEERIERTRQRRIEQKRRRRQGRLAHADTAADPSDDSGESSPNL